MGGGETITAVILKVRRWEFEITLKHYNKQFFLENTKIHLIFGIQTVRSKAQHPAY